MHKNFYGYQKGNVETRYNVEFIDDPKTWKQFQKSQKVGSDIEPWEIFKKKDLVFILIQVKWIIKFI